MTTTPMTDPRLYLAIDNCFASKRWTAPREWMPLVSDLGIRRVEASADNECDALYSHPGFLRDWADEIRAWGARTGVMVANFYSGHGTYATLGLAHTDVRVRDRMLHDWLFAMARQAGALGAGLGFFTHAFPLAVLDDSAAYAAACGDLYDRLARVAVEARRAGVRTVGVEQMYTPHQVPWTIRGARELLREVFRRASAPFYITIDTGHQVGQRRFLRPDRARLGRWLEQVASGNRPDSCWVGTRPVRSRLEQLATLSRAEREAGLAVLDREMAGAPYLFADPEDGDPYAWLGALGCYSPIIHLQQTDGTVSAHWPFDRAHNAGGIIDGRRVLAALAESYRREPEAGLPPRVEDIHLTIEVFSGTMDLPDEILSRVRDTVAYWREYIPEDGVRLSQVAGIPV